MTDERKGVLLTDEARALSSSVSLEVGHEQQR